MQVVQSVCGKFHHFHLARQLHRRELLTAIFSSYPRVKLRGEQLPPELIRTFPYVHLAALAGSRYQEKYPEAVQQLARWDRLTFDAHVARHLPECDVFVGISGTGLRTGTLAQSRGARYVCDRGSSHIRWQDQALRDAFQRWGQDYAGIDPQNIAQEEAEYAVADAITVPSHFVRRTFLEKGVPAEKVHVIPYGADLRRFSPVAAPSADSFDVLFVGQVSFRKGVPYLLDAFEKLTHPRKTLTLVGAVLPEIACFLQGKPLENVTFAGIQPNDRLKEIMSRSHVMVLPSLEEGLALVQGEAMACGCPVIATENAGAEDLFETDVEGFIIPPGDAAAITDRLERLAQDPALRARMSAAALQRVTNLGGWDTYGANYVRCLEAVLGL
jgi:starch synthase